MPCTGLIGINSLCVVHVPGPFGSAAIVDPGAGIAIGAGFVGATGVGVPAGGAGVVGVVGFVGVVGLVGFVGFVGSVGDVGLVGFVVPVATFDPLLYVQPFSAAATITIIAAMETFFILGLFS